MGKINLDGSIVEFNDEWSFKDFTNRGNLKIPSGITIYASCFSQEIPDKNIFDEISNVTFVKCNLDNVAIPKDCVTIQCSERRFKIQNDRMDWEIDENNLPTRPLNWKIYLKKGLPIPKPSDIPLTMMEAQ